LEERRPSPTLPTPPRTPAARGIAIAALSLFADTDPRRVTIRQIADAAQVSVGSIYAQYGSKDGLYLAVLSDALTLSARYTLNRKWSASPLQRVFNVGEAYVRFATENPEAFRVIAQRTAVDTTVPEIAQAEVRVTKQIEREVAAITDDLQAAMDAGEIMALPVHEVFAYLWGSWVGVLGLTVRDDPFKISADEAYRILAAAQHALARGLRPQTAS
jgi:AcrR family transcriptional regulator